MSVSRDSRRRAATNREAGQPERLADRYHAPRADENFIAIRREVTARAGNFLWTLFLSGTNSRHILVV